MDKSTSNSYEGLEFDSQDLQDAQMTDMPVLGIISPLLASRGTYTDTQQTLIYIRCS